MRSRFVLLMLLALLSAGTWAGNAKDVKNAQGADAAAPAPVKDTTDVMIQNAWGYVPKPGEDQFSMEMDVTCLTSYCKLVGVQSDLAASGAMQRYWAKHGRLVVETLTAVPMRHGHVTKFGVQTISLVLQGLKRPLHVGQHIPFSLLLLMGGKEIEVDGKALVKVRQVIGVPASGVQPQQSGA